MARFRGMLTAVAVATAGVAGATLVARGATVRNIAGLTAAVLAPYAAALAPLGAAAAVWCRGSRILTVAALAVAAAGVGVQVSWHWLGDTPPPGGSPTLRVLSANIRNGEADAPSLVRLAARSADVLIIAELTPEAVQRFSAAGINRDFPHTQLIPAPMAGGIGMWSRYPISALPVPQHPAVSAPAALLKMPGVALDVVLVAVHVKSPLAGGQNTVADWATGISHLRDQLGRFANAAGAGAVVVAGDFNATPDVRQFRNLLTGGYRDAVAQLGAGFAPTFPSDRWHPPLFTIDHVLTRNAAATSIETVDVTGSDHRGLLTGIEIGGR